MNDYVTKPVRPKELLRALAAVPARASARDEALVAAAQEAREESDATVPDATVPERAPDSWSDGVAVFDASLLEDSADGDPAFASELITSFETGVTRSLERLRAALRADDPSELSKAAHAAKGASAQIGAVRLAHICERLEQLGRSGTIAGAPELTLHAERAFVRVKEVLTTHLAFLRAA
jgi:HPt (histidine-containing phosphotransfer) domain-containing protein